MIMISIPLGFYGFRLESEEEVRKIKERGESIGVRIFKDSIGISYVGKPIYDVKELENVMDNKFDYGLDLTNKLKEININIKRKECHVLVRRSAVKMLDSIV